MRKKLKARSELRGSNRGLKVRKEGDDAFTALRGSISRESKQDKTDDLGDRGGWNRQPPADRITYK